MRKHKSRYNKNISKSKIKRGGVGSNPANIIVPVIKDNVDTGGQASIDRMNDMNLRQNELNRMFTGGGNGIVGDKIIVPTFVNGGESNVILNELTKVFVQQQSDSVYDATRPQNQSGGKYRKVIKVNKHKTKRNRIISKQTKHKRKNKKYKTLKSRRNRK